MKTKPCDICGREIGFIDMDSGGKMPVNANKIAIVIRGADLPVTLVDSFKNEDKLGRVIHVYEPHWGACKKPPR